MKQNRLFCFTHFWRECDQSSMMLSCSDGRIRNHNVYRSYCNAQPLIEISTAWLDIICCGHLAVESIFRKMPLGEPVLGLRISGMGSHHHWSSFRHHNIDRTIFFKSRQEPTIICGNGQFMDDGHRYVPDQHCVGLCWCRVLCVKAMKQNCL